MENVTIGITVQARNSLVTAHGIIISLALAFLVTGALRVRNDQLRIFLLFTYLF